MDSLHTKTGLPDWDEGWHEECGVLGIYGPVAEIPGLLYEGLYALQHRGQESAGMALTDGDKMDVFRGMGLVGEVFRSLPTMPCRAGIGHVRYSTTGSSLLCNTQPLLVRYAGGPISMAHNGNLTNAVAIRKELEGQGSIFQSSIDSEVIVNLLARSRQETVEQKMLETLEKIQGAYCLVVMTRKKLIGVRDPNGFRPLCLGKLGESWLLASESCALDTLGAEFIRDINPGEMVVIDDDGLHSYTFAPQGKKALCVFEYIYFARPDSQLDGCSVYQSRLNMGQQLARESNLLADMVMSVPDSGTTAALGFSRESGITYGEGLIKNRYIGRTFIQPEQSQRAMKVRMKLNPIRSALQGKSVVLVDDSIVRGTTSGQIVKMLKEAGAAEVHMCISSPPIAYPCYYGIDTSVRKELIAASKTTEEICQYIGADSLHYLSLEGLCASLGHSCPSDLCYACFNGDYPVPVPEECGVKGEKYVFEG